MPELPEVETTRRGLSPHIIGQKITRVIIRQPRLRWPIPENLPDLLQQQTIKNLHRRAKYLLLEFEHGWLILHLGMSGNLRILPQQTEAGKHDHIDLQLSNQQMIRFADPRRFGAVLWHDSQHPIEQHPLLQHLGPEPLPDTQSPFSWPILQADELYRQLQRRHSAIKTCLMNPAIVTGIGNIYANEILFTSGLHPAAPAHTLSLQQCSQLVEQIRQILQQAIKQGGSSLRDFVHVDGKPGYFQQQYWVYGRSHQPCRNCQQNILSLRQGQRSSFYCPQCQPAPLDIAG